MANSLLSGFRALDLMDEKGFVCGKILAAMGVDTIKIERPGGDPLGTSLPFIRIPLIRRKACTGLYATQISVASLLIWKQAGDGSCSRN